MPSSVNDFCAKLLFGDKIDSVVFSPAILQDEWHWQVEGIVTKILQLENHEGEIVQRAAITQAAATRNPSAVIKLSKQASYNSGQANVWVALAKLNFG